MYLWLLSLSLTSGHGHLWGHYLGPGAHNGVQLWSVQIGGKWLSLQLRASLDAGAAEPSRPVCWEARAAFCRPHTVGARSTERNAELVSWQGLWSHKVNLLLGVTSLPLLLVALLEA